MSGTREGEAGHASLWRENHPHTLQKSLFSFPFSRCRHRSPTWSLSSLQQRLMKNGGRLIKHARYYWLLLAEGHLTRPLFWGHAVRDRGATIAIGRGAPQPSIKGD